MAAKNVLRKAKVYGTRLFSQLTSLSPFTNNQTTVPGSSQPFLNKSHTLAADCQAYDLEDSDFTPKMEKFVN